MLFQGSLSTSASSLATRSDAITKEKRNSNKEGNSTISLYKYDCEKKLYD